MKKERRTRGQGRITAVLAVIVIVYTIFLLSCISRDNSEKCLDEMFHNIEREPGCSQEQESSVPAITEQTEIVENAKPSFLVLNTENVKKEYFIGEEIDITGLSASLVSPASPREGGVSETYSISTFERELTGNSISVTGTSESVGSGIFINTDRLEILEGSTDTCGVQTVKVGTGSLAAEYEITVSHKVEDVAPVNMYASTQLNLRNGPGTEHGVEATIPFNTEVSVTGTCRDWKRVSYGGVEYFCHGKYLMAEKYVEPVYNGPYDNIATGEPGTSQAVVDKVNAYWNKNVPESLKAWFVANEWKLVVSAQPLNERFGYPFSTAGVTSSGDRTVYIDNRENAVTRSIIHEIGHAVDFTIGFPNWSGSYSEEFQGIYEAEAENFTDCTGHSEYARTNTQEYFASVFQNIILDPSGTQASVPASFEYVSRYMP